MSERLMNVKEVAAALGLTPRAIWSMRARGTMPAPVRVGGSGGAVRWRAAEIEEWVRGGCKPVRETAEVSR